MKNAARLAAAASQPSESIRTAEPYRAPRYRVTLVSETEGTGTAEPIRDSSTAVDLPPLNQASESVRLAGSIKGGNDGTEAVQSGRDYRTSADHRD